jgi:biotin synthase-related radical SAM superfamily protein
VSTHVIVGLGETEKDAAEIIQKCVDMTVLPALFAFTPIRGTAMEDKSPPDVESYRRVQLARYLIVKRSAKFDSMQFDDEGKILDFGLPIQELKEIIESAEPFLTSGCRDCNRPFYNEKPSGPIYNFPKKPNKEEIEKIKQQFRRC